MLRQFGEPVCLFGEGEYERRERLRSLVNTRGGAPQGSVAVDALEEEDELFYTEGSEILRNHRIKIARFSIPRAQARLRAETQTRESQKFGDLVDSVDDYLETVREKIAAQVSQVGDERPLTDGRFSPDGTTFATTSWSGRVKLWDVATCKIKKVWTSQDERCHSVCFNTAKGGQPMLITSCANGTSSIFSLSNFEADPVVLSGHEDRVNKAIFHPSGQYAMSTSHDATWRLWDIETQKEILLQEGHVKPVYGCDIHPDGSIAATSDLSGVVLLWDLRSGKNILNLPGHVKQVLSVAFSPQGYTVATGSDDHGVRIFDLRKRMCIQNLLAHNKMVSEVKFEPIHGRFLMSSSYDCTLRIWNTLTYKCEKALVGHEARIMGADVHFGEHDKRLLFGSVAYDRTFKFWASNDDYTSIKKQGEGAMEL